MLEIYSGKNKLSGKARGLLIVSWIETHREEATAQDVMMAACSASGIDMCKDNEN